MTARSAPSSPCLLFLGGDSSSPLAVSAALLNAGAAAAAIVSTSSSSSSSSPPSTATGNNTSDAACSDSYGWVEASDCSDCGAAAGTGTGMEVCSDGCGAKWVAGSAFEPLDVLDLLRSDCCGDATTTDTSECGCSSPIKSKRSSADT
eukprot:6489772-Amphidinium_carterae.1